MVNDGLWTLSTGDILGCCGKYEEVCPHPGCRRAELAALRQAADLPKTPFRDV
jgi:hypothetical protein